MAPNMHIDLVKLHYNVINYYYATVEERVCLSGRQALAEIKMQVMCLATSGCDCLCL